MPSTLLAPEDALAVSVTQAIRKGDHDALKRLLEENSTLATARIGDATKSRSLLHVATDWPGHYPKAAETVRILIAAGADVNARFQGNHSETPLHWAASSDDVAVLDALLDAGADIEADGALIAGGTPLSGAVAFGQWRSARRLVARGAKTPLREAAALGLLDRVEAEVAAGAAPETITQGLWYACHGGKRPTAEYLLAQGADLHWVSTWDQLTPLDAAHRSQATELAAWLEELGARPASSA